MKIPPGRLELMAMMPFLQAMKQEYPDLEVREYNALVADKSYMLHAKTPRLGRKSNIGTLWFYYDHEGLQIVRYSGIIPDQQFPVELQVVRDEWSIVAYPNLERGVFGFKIRKDMERIDPFPIPFYAGETNSFNRMTRFPLSAHRQQKDTSDTPLCGYHRGRQRGNR